MEQIEPILTTYGLNVIGAIITLLVGYIIAKWLAKAVRAVSQKSQKIDDTVAGLFAKVTFIIIMLFTLIAVLNRFGVETTSLVAALGAAGLAVGLALQGTLSNIAAGVMILIMRPFKNGDAIKGTSGSVYLVDEIGLFITRAHEPDGPVVTIPNSKLWGDIITNFSVTHNDIRRFNMTFGIAYSDDIGKAIGIINQVLDEEEKVLEEPARLVNVSNLGDSSVDILVWAWLPRADWWVTKLELTRKIKEAFDAQGITIPFPQRDVHLFNEEKGA
jgi:small conductance mechanosensitive channel